MGDWEGKAEGLVALFGQFLGAAATPETLVGGPAAKKLGKGGSRVLKEIASHAGINAAVNPVVQKGNIDSGDQATWLWTHLLADAGMGGATGALPGMLRSRRSLVNWYKNRHGITPEQAKVLDEAITKMPEDSEGGVIGDVVGKFGKNAKLLAEQTIAPISSRLERISPGLGKVLRQNELTTMRKAYVAKSRVLPFLEQYKRMARDHRRNLDLAFKNGDADDAAFIMKKYRMTDNFRAVRDVLKELHAEGTEVGFEIGFIKDYMPRMVKNRDGLRAHLKKTGEWGPLQQAVNDRAKSIGLDPDTLTPDMRVEFTNTVLSGQGVRGSGVPGNFKKRTVAVVDPKSNKYYHDTATALGNYIESTTAAIQRRRFLGKDSGAPAMLELDPSVTGLRVQDDSVGGFVDNLLRENRLAPDKEQEVYDIFNSYFSTGRVHGGVQALRSLTHITTLGNPISALTQFKDLAFSALRNGEINTIRGVGAAIRRSKNRRFKMEDLGLDQIGQEFTDFRKLAQFTNKVFKITGFSRVDRLGKEVFIDSSYRRIQKAARSPIGSKTYKKIYDELEPALGKDTASTLKAFAANEGVENELIRFTLFDQLSDFQPITRAEMPEVYLNKPNGRIFYLLKTFTIRQMDTVRRETYDKIKAGHVKDGVSSLIKLGTYWVTLGAGVDQAKDWILGRDVEFSDLAVENLLQALGVTRWTIYTGINRGPAEAAIKTVVPPHSHFDSLWRDAVSLSQGEFEAKNAETIKHVPFVGKIYYWRYGEGAEKERGR